MHPELENLLSIALQDGVLSEKEREILFRRAEKLGVDMDEFEMELEGRVPAQDSKKKLSPNIKKKGKSAYLTDLFEKLRSVDEEIANPKKSVPTRVEGTINKAIDAFIENNPVQYGVDTVKSIFGGTTSKEKKAQEKEAEEMNRINLLISKKVTIVSSYPLSDEFSDLWEFLTLCVSNNKTIENKYNESWVYNSELDLMHTWKNKAEQIILNLRLNDLSDDLKKKIDDIELKLNPPKKKQSFWDKLSSI